jgi:hypothetical protein
MTTNTELPVTKSWSVQIDLGEHNGATHAIARLHTQDRTSLTGTGFARLNPADPNVPEIGDELICSGLLSSGRVRRPARVVFGAGASCFVELIRGERVVGDARSD